MHFIRRNLEYLAVAIIISGFVFVAAQKLGTVPVPDSDEAMMLQISYEMLYRGKLAFPMKRIYGGNIENSWHSYTPLYFVTLSGFLKIFGWGLEQARAFNLITAALLLVVTFLVGRRMFGRWVGLTAVVLMISDPVFLGRSRLARNDLIAAAFGMLAFYLFETAEERKKSWHYACSGLAAGAAVMCHTNMIYMLAVVFALMLARRGWRVIKAKSLYLFGACALAVMAYEIIYAIVDYQNFVLQGQKDKVHFRVLEPLGWFQNLLYEPNRYVEWYNARNVKFAEPSLLLHLFLLAAAAAIIYLIIRSLIHIRRGNFIDEPRVRLTIATLVTVLVFAAITQRKVIQYVIHLAPWFALSLAMLLKDIAARVLKMREREEKWPRPAYQAAMAIGILLIAGYGYGLARQNQQYLARVTDPELATFYEVKEALRDIVPEGVCPASIGNAFVWLAFPEQDDCYFAYTEVKNDEPIVLDGKEYALVVKPKILERLNRLTGGVEKYHLLGEIKKTAYGTLRVYYTGTDPRILALAPKRYQFFGRKRGFITDEGVSDEEVTELQPDDTD